MKFDLQVSWLRLPHCPNGQLEKGTLLSAGYDIKIAEDMIVYSHAELKKRGKFKYVKVCKLEDIDETKREEVLSYEDSDNGSFYVGEDNEGDEALYRIKYDAQLAKTGFCLKADELCFFGIHLRSSTSKIGALALANSTGIVDFDYQGYEDEIFLNLTSYSEDSYFLARGERIAQLIPYPYTNLSLQMVEREREWEAFNRGGFGSTGGIYGLEEYTL